MNGGHHQTKFGAWRLNGHPQVVEYAQPVLDALVAQGVNGLRGFPHGGMAVGAILFGNGDRHLVRILAARPIACEYAGGPSFTLSAADHDRLAEQLGAYLEDPELKDLVPVGWHHSIIHGELSLTPADIEVHERHFPGQNQIAVALRLAEPEPASIGVFIHQPAGGIGAEPALIVEGIRSPAMGPPETPPERKPAPAPSWQPPGPVKPPVPEKDMFASFGAGKTAGRERRGFPKWLGVAGGAAVVAAGLWAVDRWLMPPEFRQAIGDRLDSAPGYLQTVSDYWLRPAGPDWTSPLSLQLRADGRNLVVRWNPSSSVIAGATSAVLLIEDGAAQIQQPLELPDLASGHYSFRRLTDDIRVRLTVLRPEASPHAESARLLAPPAPAPEAAPGSSPEEIQAEIERLKSALLMQQEQTRTFQNTLEAIRRIEMDRPEPEPAPAAKPAPAEVVAQAAPPAQREQPPAPAPIFEQRPAATLTQAPPAASPLSGVPVPVQTSSARGSLIWTGFLPPNQVVTIENGRPTLGSLSGRLPGGPVRVSVCPGELSGAGLTAFTADREQAAGGAGSPPGDPGGAAYRFDPERARTAAMVEPPSAANNWRRLAVRASGKPVTVLVIAWERAR